MSRLRSRRSRAWRLAGGCWRPPDPLAPGPLPDFPPLLRRRFTESGAARRLHSRRGQWRARRRAQHDQPQHAATFQYALIHHASSEVRPVKHVRCAVRRPQCAEACRIVRTTDDFTGARDDRNCGSVCAPTSPARSTKWGASSRQVTGSPSVPALATPAVPAGDVALRSLDLARRNGACASGEQSRR
jgi:hypothetical protein